MHTYIVIYIYIYICVYTGNSWETMEKKALVCQGPIANGRLVGTHFSGSKTMTCRFCKEKVDSLRYCAAFCKPQLLACPACYIPVVGKGGREIPTCTVCWDYLLTLEDDMPVALLPLECEFPIGVQVAISLNSTSVSNRVRVRTPKKRKRNQDTSVEQLNHLCPAPCTPGNHVCVPCLDPRCNSSCVQWTADHCMYACYFRLVDSSSDEADEADYRIRNGPKRVLKGKRNSSQEGNWDNSQRGMCSADCGREALSWLGHSLCFLCNNTSRQSPAL